MTVWCLLEVWATGEKLRAVAPTRHGLIGVLQRVKGVVISERDVQETAVGWKVRVGTDIYTLREAPVGEWL